MRRRGGRVWNPRGEPRGFIVATDARRATVRLDLRACHAHRCFMSRDTRLQSLSAPTKIAPNGSSSQATGLFSKQRRRGPEKFPSLVRLGPERPGSAQPSRRTSQTRDGPVKDKDSGTRAPMGLQLLKVKTSAKLSPVDIPANGTLGFPQKLSS